MVKKMVIQSGSFALMCSVACGALLLTAPKPAQAGFSFVPPAEKEVVKTPSLQKTSTFSAERVIEEDSKNSQDPMPSADIAEEVLPPLASEPLSLTEEKPKTVLPVIEKEEPAIKQEDPVAEQQEDSAIPAMEMVAFMEEAPVLEEGVGAIVDGFGSDIPLVIALRQIVPSEYSFIFGDKLDLGMRVDWQGGQPWDGVLHELAKTYGFEIDITKRIVQIRIESAKQEPVDIVHQEEPQPLDIILEEDVSDEKSKTSPEEPPLLTRSQTRPQPLDLPDMEDLTKKESEPPKEYKVPVKEQSGSLFVKKRILVEKPDGAVRAFESEPKAVAEYEIEKVSEDDIEWNAQNERSEQEAVTPDTPDITTQEKAALAPAQEPQPLTSQLEKSVEEKDVSNEMEPIELDEPPATDLVIEDSAVKENRPAAVEQVEIVAPPAQNLADSDRVEDKTSLEIAKPNDAFFIENEISVWEAEKGTTLRAVLQEWANAEGISLVWSSEYDYPIHADMQIVGTFEEAVGSALDGFERASPRPMGRLHTNKPTGAPVLVIQSERLTN